MVSLANKWCFSRERISSLRRLEVGFWEVRRVFASESERVIGEIWGSFLRSSERE